MRVVWIPILGNYKSVSWHGGPSHVPSTCGSYLWRKSTERKSLPLLLIPCCLEGDNVTIWGMQAVQHCQGKFKKSTIRGFKQARDLNCRCCIAWHGWSYSANLTKCLVVILFSVFGYWEHMTPPTLISHHCPWSGSCPLVSKAASFGAIPGWTGEELQPFCSTTSTSGICPEDSGEYKVFLLADRRGKEKTWTLFWDQMPHHTMQQTQRFEV